MPWYKSLNAKLLPMQNLVNVLLILVILISVYMLISKNNVLKTTWTVFVLSP